MYVYVNTTEAALQVNFTKLFELQERVRNGTGEIMLMPGKTQEVMVAPKVEDSISVSVTAAAL